MKGHLVTVAVPSPMWRRAAEFAAEAGHSLDRDVWTPALLEYIKIQADLGGYKLGKCAACNVTTVDGECVECGWTNPCPLVTV
jgi:hypothetical protein